MDLEFVRSTDSRYAMNPQIEKRQGSHRMRMAQHGCTHFLIMSSPLNVEVDFEDPKFQESMASIGEPLDAKDTLLPGFGNVTVTCISYPEYRRNNEYIELPDRVAAYAVYGCLESGGVLKIFLPMKGMIYQTSVAVDLRYSINPFMREVRRGFRRVTEQTPFYEVLFEKKNSFANGSVVYTIGNEPYRFAITENMLGRSVYIKSEKEMPRFEAAASGINLQRK